MVYGLHFWSTISISNFRFTNKKPELACDYELPEETIEVADRRSPNLTICVITMQGKLVV